MMCVYIIKTSLLYPFDDNRANKVIWGRS